MSNENDFHVLNGRVAGFVTRLFAYVIDVAVVAGIVALGGWIAVLIDNTLSSVNIDPRIDMATIYVFMIPFIIALYFVMFWSLTGRTIGKWFMGLRVVAKDGKPPSIGHSLIRVFGYAVSAIVFWVGYLWVLIDDERQAWHDHMARTFVVYDYSRRPSGQTYDDYRSKYDSQDSETH